MQSTLGDEGRELCREGEADAKGEWKEGGRRPSRPNDDKIFFIVVLLLCSFDLVLVSVIPRFVLSYVMSDCKDIYSVAEHPSVLPLEHFPQSTAGALCIQIARSQCLFFPSVSCSDLSKPSASRVIVTGCHTINISHSPF